jgi:hypothetical protein
MLTRRRFQPVVLELPFRIAPSAVAVAVPAAIAAIHPAGPPTMSPYDAEMPETGTSTPIIVAPPTSGGDGTLTC